MEPGKSNSVGPITGTGDGKPKTAKNLSSYISPIQLLRIRQDALSWRNAIAEAERPYFPYRVKMQTIFKDTVQNGHVFSALEKAKDLILLKEFGLYNGETLDEKATALIKKEWFYNIMNYTLDAKFFGYSLIGIGDMVNDEFPNVEIIRRENVSPDREEFTTFAYMPHGLNFSDNGSKDEAGNKYFDWSIWIPTPSDLGISQCGYGLLYKIALYEIFMRNNLAQNADFVEVYGQPFRHLKSDKTGDERDKAETDLSRMGSNPWIITDLDEELIFIESNSTGSGWKSYDNFDTRLMKVVSKIVFGHSNAIDSTTGKLGNGNDEKSPEQIAINDTETKLGRFFEYHANDQIIPKLRNIGLSIPEGLVFKLKNDKEKKEIRDSEDKSNATTSDIVYKLKQAGFDVDPKYITDRTGIPVTKAEVVPPASPFGNNPSDKVKNKLKELYGKKP